MFLLKRRRRSWRTAVPLPTCASLNRRSFVLARRAGRLHAGSMSDDVTEKLPGPLLRHLKAKGQLMPPTLMVGKLGLSPEFMRSLEAELTGQELVKVKFAAFKEEKKELVKQLVAATRSHLVMRVGNVAVLYRQQPDPAKRKFAAS